MDSGIDHFIDLTEPHELEPFEDIAIQQGHRVGRQIGQERHPIPDVSVPAGPGEVAFILDAIDAAPSNGKSFYVHCWGGVGRTGTVIGCWLVRHGSDGQRALAQVDVWWGECKRPIPSGIPRKLSYREPSSKIGR